MARLLIAIDDHPRNYASLATVRALRAAGHEPVVAGPARHAYAAVSRAAAGFAQVPAARDDPQAFVVALARVAADVDAVLPASETSLVALAGREAEFGGVPVGVGPAANIARATEKAALAELAAGAALATPPSRTLARDGLLAAEIELPAIAKPGRSLVDVEGGGRRRAWAKRLDTRADVEAAAAADHEWVIQPFLDGRLYGVGGVAWRGEVVATMHQVSRRLWPPLTGGSSFALSVPRDEELDRRLGRVIRELDWSGIFQAQLIEHGGERYLIDLNLRVYGSIGLAIASGVNLPAIWAAVLLGREPATPAYRPGVSFRAPERDLRALALLFRQGRRGDALRGLLPHRPGVQSVLSVRDPRPAAAFAAQLLRAARD